MIGIKADNNPTIAGPRYPSESSRDTHEPIGCFQSFRNLDIALGEPLAVQESKKSRQGRKCESYKK